MYTNSGVIHSFSKSIILLVDYGKIVIFDFLFSFIVFHFLSLDTAIFGKIILPNDVVMPKL